MLNEYKKEFFSFDQDWGYVIYPENISKDIPVVLHFHGNRGYVKDGGADWLDEPKKQNFFKPALDSGFAIAGCHATGNHWGRGSAILANYKFFEQLKNIAELNLNNITTWGCGLGASAAWLTSIGELNPYVKNFISQQGVLNFESIIRREKFKDELIEAHNRDISMDIEKAVQVFDPIKPITKTKLIIDKNEKKFPNSLFIHGDADENVDYSENPVMLNKLLSDIGTNSKLNPLAGVGHATYEHGEELGLIIAKFLLEE